MLKHQVNLSLTDETALHLRKTAERVQAPIGDLADLCLRFALDKLPEDRLRAWAAQLPSTLGRLGGAPTKNERLVLGAFAVLSDCSEFGADEYCYSTPELAMKAGVLPKEAFAALQSLARRGLVDGIESFEADRHGRPTESFWWPAGRSATHPRFPMQRPGEAKDRGWVSYVQCWELLESWIRGGREKALLYQRVVDVRRMAFSQLMDPWVAGLIERDARWAFGISSRALALKPRIVDPSASPPGTPAGG